MYRPNEIITIINKLCCHVIIILAFSDVLRRHAACAEATIPIFNCYEIFGFKAATAYAAILSL